MKKRLIIILSIAGILVIASIFIILYARDAYIKDVYEILSHDISGGSTDMDPVLIPQMPIFYANIYEGTVKEISFDVFDCYNHDWYRGGTVHEPEHFLNIATIYKIEVDKVYQGKEKEYYYVREIGGIEGYRDFEQGSLLKDTGIPGVYRRFGSIGNIIGKKMLFLTGEWGSDDLFGEVHEVGSEQYNEIIKYLESEECKNPPKPQNETVIDTSDMMYNTVEELVENTEQMFEGEVLCVNYLSGYVDENTRRQIISYNIRILDGNIEMPENTLTIKMYGCNEEVDVPRQYMNHVFRNISEWWVYKNASLPKQGQKYLFTFTKGTICKSSFIFWVPNPAQFAFALDDSNAPGGITYSMIKKYMDSKK